MEHNEKTTCKECLYSSHIGNNVFVCKSEKRRMANLLMVHDFKKETFTCEYAEYLYKEKKIKGATQWRL